ncbi:hypothetical protein JOF56_004590 [Kibdelosporangium banguiense]|uniref:Uncharacterized protein n=1 Tax=Kibdelosporangium banguiense TaxID=1365924 RepID=A0ABS4TIE6_9PSEU|nr:hypothetical protein [Kibdelosporangium banguiense]MBP2324205.1 hypothetical protein [Kibdelosporangium banguiense]
MLIPLPIRLRRQVEVAYYFDPKGDLQIYTSVDNRNHIHTFVTFHGVTEMRLAKCMHDIEIDMIEQGPDRFRFSVEADDYIGGYVLATGMTLRKHGRSLEQVVEPWTYP